MQQPLLPPSPFPLPTLTVPLPPPSLNPQPNYLANIGTLQTRDSTQPTTSRTQFRHLLSSRLPFLRFPNPARLSTLKNDFQILGCSKPGLDLFPDLFLRIKLRLRITRVTVERDLLARRSIRGWGDELYYLFFMRIFGSRGWGRGGGKDHGGGLDAAHGDGLEIGDANDFAVLHVGEWDEPVEA